MTMKTLTEGRNYSIKNASSLRGIELKDIRACYSGKTHTRPGTNVKSHLFLLYSGDDFIEMSVLERDVEYVDESTKSVYLRDGARCNLLKRPMTEEEERKCHNPYETMGQVKEKFANEMQEFIGGSR